MKPVLAVLLFGAMIAAAAPTTAKERVGTIVGIVLDADGNPAEAPASRFRNREMVSTRMRC